MYLIEEGRLRVACTPRVHVATLGIGETFGAVSALRGTPRTTTVEAVTPVRLRTLSGETLDALAAALPSFRDMLDDWVAQHDSRPGAAVSTLAIEQERARSSEPRRRCRRQSMRHLLLRIAERELLREGPSAIARPVHPADRRDGLRRRVPRDGGARVRPASEPRPHSPVGERRPRWHQPALHLPRGRRAGPRDAIGQDLGAPSRSHASASHRALGRAPLDCPGRRPPRPRRRRRSGAGPPAVDARDVRPPLERLRGALRLHAGARAGAPVDAHAGMDVAARPAARRPPSGGARARGGRQRAADGAADFHAGDRGPGARRPGSVPAPRDDRGDGRDDGLHRPVARAAAISPQLLGGENRCGGARLPHAAPPGAAHVVLRLAPDRRSAASSRRHPSGARLPRPARHRRHHGRRPTVRDGGS